MNKKLIIHLDECDEIEHPIWARETYAFAVAKGGELCPEAAYMSTELYNDEPVWIETVDEKPKWAQLTEQANRLAQEAAIARRTAHDVRCQERESGGEQCTADAEPADHAHRIQDADMPS